MSRIMEKVETLLKKYNTNDPFELAEALNVDVQFADLGDTFGFYFASYRYKIININNQIEDLYQRFTCAHELGHAVLHPKSNTPFLRKNTFYSIDKIEVEANTFAVELLLPNETLNNYKDTNISIYDACVLNGIPKELAHLKYRI